MWVWGVGVCVGWGVGVGVGCRCLRGLGCGCGWVVAETHNTLLCRYRMGLALLVCHRADYAQQESAAGLLIADLGSSLGSLETG